MIEPISGIVFGVVMFLIGAIGSGALFWCLGRKSGIDYERNRYAEADPK